MSGNKLNYHNSNISFTNAYCGTKIFTYTVSGNIVRNLKAWRPNDLVQSSLCHMPSGDPGQVTYLVFFPSGEMEITIASNLMVL